MYTYSSRPFETTGLAGRGSHTKIEKVIRLRSLEQQN
jgi:hypothetical protein